ncbi:thioredoxin family protein [uncultured Tateyamaria sp.]|uniref:thioredoxin family protein n=1 Tax=Tateyamaria sp. 1078 TaxID=3417464 RepID=UPI00260C2A1F|nr:thioredoxin family protein [uncultured Tateyamaria sp.]
MHRRTLLISAAAAALPLGAHASYPAQVFTPALWRDLREDDRAVIFNYRASWSLTCQIKAELIADALAENPDYQRLSFVDIDWDTFGQSQLTQRLKVKRRSTLLVMKRGKEIARLENEPYARRVRALLDMALTA